MRRLKRLVTASGEYLVFCPGNGTRYEVVISKVVSSSESETDWRSAWMILWVNRGMGGVGAVFAEVNNVLHHQYFREKLGMNNEADTAALLSLFHEVTGRPVVMPMGYDLDGIWKAELDRQIAQTEI